MTSTKSAYKSNFFAVVRKTFKQQLVREILIYALAILAPLVGLAYQMVTMLDFSYDYYNDVTMTVATFMAFMLVACGFFSLSIAPKMFKEIYKKQSCDLFFSLPVKRSEYFFGKYIVGLLTNAIAFGVSSTIYYFTIKSAYNNANVTVNSKFLLQLGISLLLSLTVAYTLFVFCAVVSGKRIHYILLSIICLLLTGNAVSGFVSALNTVWGLNTGKNIPSVLNPMTSSVTAFSTQNNFPVLYAVSIVEIIVLLWAGYAVFRKRKAEVAEVALSGNVAPYVILAVFTTSLFMSYGATYNLLLSLIMGAIVVAIAGLIYSAIFYKKAYTQQTATTVISVCLVCTIFMMSVYLPSHSRYVNKIPEADQVAGIEFVECGNDTVTTGLLSAFTNLAYGYYDYDDMSDDYSSNQKFTIESEQGIKSVLALHKKLVDEKTISESKGANILSFLDVFASDTDHYSADMYTCQIKYNLKNGRSIVRYYDVSAKCIIDEIADVFRNEEVLDQTRPFNTDKDRVLFSTVSIDQTYTDLEYDTESEENADAANYQRYINENNNLPIDLTEFLSAYKQDLLEIESAYGFIQATNSYYDISSMYSSSNDTAMVAIYSLSDNCDKKSEEKLRSMSKMEIIDLATSYNEEEPLFDCVNVEYVYINGNYSHSTELAKKAGINFYYTPGTQTKKN